MHSDPTRDDRSSRTLDNVITCGFLLGAAAVVFAVRSEGTSTASSATIAPPRQQQIAVPAHIAAKPVVPVRPAVAEPEAMPLPTVWGHGSTKADVLRIEGNPHRSFSAGPREFWFYRRLTSRGFPVESQVRFDFQGRVESWVDVMGVLRTAQRTSYFQ